jgi:hypothetical protein
MRMPVMDIRIGGCLRVSTASVRVGVRFVAVPLGDVRVLVMLVMTMGMRMLERFVGVSR